MATKRKFNLDEGDGDWQQIHVSNKKHTLDSDEEDSDDYEKDNNASDVEGEEEGEPNIEDEVKITPFNMREEMQEGHFDVDGTYHLNKEADIKDNWLDNIDWVKVEKNKNALNPNNTEDSSLMDKAPDTFNETQKYSELLHYMQPGETVQQTLQRLDKSRIKISSAERLRRKKLGIVDEASEKITKLTELANELLTKTGNMDIYQETYEKIARKQRPATSKKNQSTKQQGESFDMYADDFDEKEQEHLHANDEKSSENKKKQLAWEFKWTQADDAEINGPHNTQQMLKWSQENYFKTGVYVRKVGEESKFYTSNRIDFELYL